MAPQRRHLRNFLLDRKYQLHFTLIMVLVAALLTAGLGSFWYAEVRSASRILEVEALASLSDAEVNDIRKELDSSDHKRLALLVGFGLLLALLLTGYGIVTTHRVAGPLYKISRHVGDIREGKLHPLHSLRRKDQLREFWEGFCEMHEQLRRSARDEAALLDQATVALRQAVPGSSELVANLEKLRDDKRASLGDENAS